MSSDVQNGLNSYIQSLYNQYQQTLDLDLLNTAIDLACEAADNNNNNDGDSRDIDSTVKALCDMLSMRYNRSDSDESRDMELLERYLPVIRPDLKDEETATATANRLQEVLDYNEKLEEEMKNLRIMTQILEEDLQNVGASSSANSSSSSASSATTTTPTSSTTSAASTAPSEAENVNAKIREDVSCMICMNVVYKSPVTTQCCDTTMCAPCLKEAVLTASDRCHSCPNCRDTPKVNTAGSMFAAVVRRVLTDEEEEEEELDSGRQREGRDTVNGLFNA